MALKQSEKVFYVLEFAKTEARTLVQCAFHTKFRRDTEKKVHIEIAW